MEALEEVEGADAFTSPFKDVTNVTDNSQLAKRRRIGAVYTPPPLTPPAVAAAAAAAAAAPSEDTIEEEPQSEKATLQALVSDERRLPSDWCLLWPRLKALGWRKELGSRGSGVQPYYMPPGVDRDSARFKNRVDYFDSQKLVIQHVHAAQPQAQPQALVAAPLEAQRGPGRPTKGPKGRPPAVPRVTGTVRTVRSTGEAREAHRADRAEHFGNQGAEAQAAKSEPGSRQPLRGWCVVATGFDGPSLGRLRALAAKLGATCSESIPRIPPASLAVLAPRPLGTAKFLFALAWGVPPLKEKWLEETARLGAPAPAEPYALALRAPGVLIRGWEFAFDPQTAGFLQRAGDGLGVNVRGSRAFRDAWSPVLRAAGARLLEVSEGCSYVVSEQAPLILPADEFAKLHEFGVAVVSADWVKTCLECQKEVFDLTQFSIQVVKD